MHVFVLGGRGLMQPELNKIGKSFKLLTLIRNAENIFQSNLNETPFKHSKMGIKRKLPSLIC